MFAAIDPGAMVIVDCLALWVTNLLGEDDEVLLAEAEVLVARISERGGVTVVVTTEVGSGIVPDNPLARRFRDLLGSVNQAFVTGADRSYLCVGGRLLELQRPEWLVG